MEDRYEIRGKIGQGGLGGVYRAYDTRMNREVAIKRITHSSSDAELEQESTRQLMKEAGALAALQHPHIVTVYDYGSDEDGPYVVMELISGKTLDELIENAPLTWPDFRELALQTQEALIAAQELDLIHSDLKPSNLMLTWLPSGKFQVKIVDFGLATLARSQSKEDLSTIEAVFGSVFFMPPEQFERQPLDARSDMYSIGCVYYQALAGAYPFDGTTGNEVMEAHLQHLVTPLQEMRSDIPLWVCDWIMWHLNRMPEHRPESARQALSVFLQNDQNPAPAMSTGAPKILNSAQSPNRPTPQRPTPKLPHHISPGAVQEHHFRPAVPAQAATSLSPAKPAAVLPAEAPTTTPTAKTKTAPQPLSPPEGSKPSIHSQAPPTTSLATAQPTSSQPALTRRVTPRHAPKIAHPKTLSKNAKIAVTAAIAVVACTIIVFLSWFLLDRYNRKKELDQYNQVMFLAAKEETTELRASKSIVEMALRAVTNPDETTPRSVIIRALSLIKATDKTNVDALIAEVATQAQIAPDVRDALVRDVLGKRQNPAIIPVLIQYAASTPNPQDAVVALEAIRAMSSPEHFNSLLEIHKSTQYETVRNSAEENIAQIIGKSSSRSSIADQLTALYQSTKSETSRYSLLRLLGRCGGEKALALVNASLASNNPQDKVAAISSLGNGSDAACFDSLIHFLNTTQDATFHARALDAAIRFASNPPDPTASKHQKRWESIVAQARTREEQEKTIRGLESYNAPWAIKLIESYKKADDDTIVDLAEKALDRISHRKRTKAEK